MEENNRMGKTRDLFPRSSVGKESACNAGDLGLIPGSGRSPGEGNVYPLRYSCLENPMDRGAWWTIAHKESDMTELLTLAFVKPVLCSVLHYFPSLKHAAYVYL